MTGRIHSIETFGTVDGPGVRYVVFFQGCTMRCRYCHNPDTWTASAGKSLTVEEVMARMLRNRPFYETGGITATGGEPLLQLPFLTALFEAAKKEGIHTCLDTSGILFDPEDAERMAAMDRLLDVTDLVMLDIKHIDEEAHRALTGQSNRNVLAFAHRLRERGIPMRVRHVLVPGITDGEDALKALGRFLAPFDNLEKIEILPYHELGKVKYQRLGIPYPLEGTPCPTEGEATAARRTVEAGRATKS